MNILYIGQVVHPHDIPLYSGISVAGNQMQYNIVTSLAQISKNGIKIVSVPPVAPFPREKKLLFRKAESTLVCGIMPIPVESPAFINIPIIKQFSQAQNVYSGCRRIINSSDIDAILTYNLYPQTGLSISRLLKKTKLPVFVVLADLPIDDNPKRNLLSKSLMRAYNRLTKRAISQNSRFIILNNNAAQFLPEGSRHIVVEGGIDPGDYENGCRNSINMHESSKAVIYSGALSEYSGIMELVLAWEYVKDQALELHIYGGGYLEKEIDEIASKSDGRIKYFGCVERAKILDIQRDAWLLVNPRNSFGSISSFTFPSKLLEYLSSGTPVVSTIFPGMPTDYQNMVTICRDASPEGLAEVINSISDDEYKLLQRKASEAREYILRTKSWNAQARRIQDFMEASLS